MKGWEGLTEYSKNMYKERYFLTGEVYEEWVDRVAAAYSDGEEHKNRMKKYITNYWFHPSTPVSSNAGRPDRGLPISCYTNEVEDSKEGIFDVWQENNWLGSYGGGIGTTWSKVRAIGDNIGESGGKSSGVIPFIKVSDASTLAVSQGNLRRASQAVYLDVSHPEIEEFIDIRRPTGDSERRSPNIHHGVTISDEFMLAVKYRGTWDLVSPKTGEIIKTIKAFDLWKKILVSRVETGEPYMFFKDTANLYAPSEYKETGRTISTSNLCSEIMLHTDKDTSGVCCLTSLNLETYREWAEDELFISDVHRFTDNILQSFINLTLDMKGFEKARKGALEERSIGIGVMGLHSMLQQNNLPVQALASKYLISSVFKKINSELEKSNKELAIEKGPALISKTRRNVNTMAIAPTASISTLCNLSSPGVDTRVSNIYIAKTNIGTYTIKNKYLEKILTEKYNKNTEEVWRDITKNQGSVQHLEWLSDEDKEVFKTAFEVNPIATIENSAIMAKYVSQGISTNLFLPADIHVQTLHDTHMRAWELEMKSLYYVRSQALNRAKVGTQDRVELEIDTCTSCA